MSQTQRSRKIEVAPSGRLTAGMLKFELDRFSKRDIPPRTIRHWRYEIGIYPDEHGFYSTEDLKILQAWIASSAQGLTFKQFLILLKESQGNAY